MLEWLAGFNPVIQALFATLFTWFLTASGAGLVFFFTDVKRKVLDWDDEKLMSPHQAYRVQTFTPPSGKIKLNRAKNAINDFITTCFSTGGEIKEIQFNKNPSKWNCNFCPYKEDKENCGEGLAY